MTPIEKTRRVILLSTAGVNNNAGTQCNWIATVVCNDGSVWALRDVDDRWHRLPSIPQSPEAPLPLTQKEQRT